MISVKGKWALITGASRGIGYLTAQFMAEQGCNLVLHSRALAHSEKILKEVKALGVAVGAFVDDGNNSHFLNASNFANMSLEDAVKKAATL